MANDERQLNLFDTEVVDLEKVILYALGDFQERGFELIGRKLPLDRLLGAFKRSFEYFDIDEISDQKLSKALQNLGARIDEVPNYVAKHPFRVTVNKELADRGLEFYKSQQRLEK